MLNKEIPFLRIGLPICLGIISGLYFKPDTYSLVASASIVVLGFSLSLFFNKYQNNLVYGYTFTFALFICGILLYTNEKRRLSTLDHAPATFLCTLSEYPEERKNSYKIIVKLNKKITENRQVRLNGSLLLYSRKDTSITSLLPGDLLRIECTPSEIINRGNPNEFDYRFYMENQGFRYYAFTNSTYLIDHQIPEHRKLIHRALIIREKIIGMYKKRGITGNRLALVAAITLGQKNMLDPEQKQSFINAGVMHIMAVSGLHAVILSLFVFNLLFFLKKRFNIFRVIITILFLWSFAFVTGLTPSVLRATLMFSFLHAGKLMKRNVNSVNSVLASAFVLTLIRPSVIFDAGFLLSYSAVIFIICFYQDLYLKLQFKNWLPDKIWQAAVVTLVAQAGTLPLTITLFNRFPTYFILTNIIIVPLSSLLIIIGCLVPLTFPVKFISQPLASILSYLTGITEILTEKASSLPFSTIEHIGMTNIECILLSCTILLFTWFILKKQSFSVHYPLIALLLFIIAVSIKEISNRTSNEIIVYNSIGSSDVGIRTGKILTLYSDTCIAKPEILRHCATSGLKLKVTTIDKKGHFIRTGEKNILICNALNTSLLQKTKPDLIILTGKNPQVNKEVDFIQPAEGIILTSEVASGYHLPGKIENEKVDTIHYVKRSGAFQMKL